MADLARERPPEGWKNWKQSDYEQIPRACKLRLLCIDAIKALVAHQRGRAEERDVIGSSLERLQGRFIEMGIFPGMHHDKWTYYPTESPLGMAECRASELSRYCGVGMPSQDVFVAQLLEETILDESDGSLAAALPPTPNVAEFAASQMYLNICADQLDAEKEIFGT